MAESHNTWKVAMKTTFILLALLALSYNLQAQPLKVATWNLGWHVSEEEVPGWIERCSKSFLKDKSSGVWMLVSEDIPNSQKGWDVKESRAALEGVDLSKSPPCSAYKSPTYEGIAITAPSYKKRVEQISRFIKSDIQPDIIAFQEVSGVKAVEEALGNLAHEYYVCSFDSKYKIQRLAFAWKKSLGGSPDSCADIENISLPTLPEKDQVRPGYTLNLTINGKKIGFLTVHLKSSCVSSLQKDFLDTSDESSPCWILQQQITPLEHSIEKFSSTADHFVILGDFNRNLWHEQNKVIGSEAVRSDGETNLATEKPDGVTKRNLLYEINDHKPASSELALLNLTCKENSNARELCEKSKKEDLNRADVSALARSGALGCRNPIGLDQILVSKTLIDSVTAAWKVSIGNLGISLTAKPPQHLQPLLAISDHCPAVIELDL